MPTKRITRKLNSLIEEPKTRTALAAVGACVAAGWLIKSGKFILENIFRSPLNLAERYGAGTWAVITGASDGIGKAFAIQLAARGFNLALIARNRSKMEVVARQLTELNANIQIRIVVADFEDSFQPNFYEKIYSQLEDLDMSILINNVGEGQRNLFPLAQNRSLFNLVSVNCVSQVMMTNFLLKRLHDSKKRAAIINISSSFTETPIPFLQSFTATKAYNLEFGRELAEQYRDQLDVLNLKPGLIATEKSQLQHGLLIPSVRAYVESALNSLGRKTEAHGHWKSKLFTKVLRNVPSSWMISEKEFVERNNA